MKVADNDPVVLAGWYSDPADSTMLRYWDGAAWTAHVAPGVSRQPDSLEAHLHRVGDRVIVYAGDVGAGLVPAGCAPHGRTGGTDHVKFFSKTPAWIYLTIVLGLIWPVIIGAILRKTVTAPAWPVCDECRHDRRRNLLWMWVALVSWLPAFLLYSIIPWTLPDLVTLLLLAAVVLGPLLAAVWFSDRARLARGVQGQVSADGLTVSFPARVFPQPSASGASGAVSVLPS